MIFDKNFNSPDISQKVLVPNQGDSGRKSTRESRVLLEKKITKIWFSKIFQRDFSRTNEPILIRCTFLESGDHAVFVESNFSKILKKNTANPFPKPDYSFFEVWQKKNSKNGVNLEINPHAPVARKNCGSALTHRYFGEKKIPFYVKWCE